MAERFVLDAYAVLVLLDDAPGAEDMAAILSDEESEVHIGAINVGEIEYIVHRRAGAERARAVEEAIYDHPRLRVAEVTRERVREAAGMKAVGGLSFADAFAAALALEFDAYLVTGDPEFRRLQARGLRLRWLGPGT
ncbi:MAG: PIN domain-containing protein [Clostridia bacterium]|nr:PIN domain-containing protein [Clostridia bacterium]